MNKKYEYYVDFDVEVEGENDLLQITDQELYYYDIEVIKEPESFGPEEATIRIFVTSQHELENLADDLYDKGYINDQEYETFEEKVEIYNGDENE